MSYMSVRKLLWGVFVGVNATFAQTTDLFRLEYSYVPNPSKNDVQKFRSLVQIPIPIKEDYLVIGLDYRYIKLDFTENVPFSVEDLNSVQRLEATLGYVYKLNDDWRLALRAGARLDSNLDGKIVNDDWIYLASAYAINDKLKDTDVKHPYRLIMGLMYTSTPGRNFPLPFVNYHVEYDRWSYSLGVPKSNIHYYLNDKNHVQGFATLDNFFANIQQNKVIDGKLAENISMTNVLLGVGYEYYFTKHLLYYVYVAHSVYNNYRLRNNDREDVYVIEDKNSLYFRSGIRFKF